jgi:hypothetical protein
VEVVVGLATEPEPALAAGDRHHGRAADRL